MKQHAGNSPVYNGNLKHGFMQILKAMKITSNSTIVKHSKVNSIRVNNSPILRIKVYINNEATYDHKN
jgi:hypothetical protein